VAEAELFQSLVPFNTHWQGGDVSELVKRHRHVRRSFKHMRDRLHRLPFELMAGPRQVGKTTLMGHLMQSLVDEGIACERIAYALLDSPPTALELRGSLDSLVATLERFLLRKPLTELSGEFYLFLDEIQTLPDWDRQLKGLYDRYQTRLRVLATGSSSAAIVNPPTADFAGRVARSRLYPLKFSETLEQVLPQGEALGEQARRMRQTVEWARGPRGSRDQLATAFRELYDQALPHAPEVERAFDTYLVRGGYPGAQQATSEEVYRFFETGIDTVLAKDLRTYEGVRKPSAFRAFLTRAARDHSGKINAARMARDVSVDETTIPQWVDIGIDLFLLERLPAVNESLFPLPRKAEKLYVQDPGVLSYLTGESDLPSLVASGRIGSRLEGTIVDHTKRLQFNAFRGRNAAIGYWSDPETDIVAELPGMKLALEVKKGGKRGESRLRSLLDREPGLLAVMVTEKEMDTAGEVWKLPAWLWALTA
jgi:predicted AAA+ superfamily ATPase